MDPPKARHSGPTKQPKKLNGLAGDPLDRRIIGPEYASQDIGLKVNQNNIYSTTHVEAEYTESRHLENQTDGGNLAQTQGEDIASVSRPLSPNSQFPGLPSGLGATEGLREGPGPPSTGNKELEASSDERDLPHHGSSSSTYYTYISGLNNNDNIKSASVTPSCYACMFPLTHDHCPQYHQDRTCPHSLDCQQNICTCLNSQKVKAFYSLSKGTLKRHRRQETVPTSDFGASKARAMTKERIKQSMLPFQNSNQLAYSPISPQELFIEFLNMLQGKFKRDMLEYLVREARVLPILDIELVKSKRTYTKTELDNFSKIIGFKDNDNIDIDKLIAQCQGFILDEPNLVLTKDPLEQELPNSQLEIKVEQQDAVNPYRDSIHLVEYLKSNIKGNATKDNKLSFSNRIEDPSLISKRYCDNKPPDIERTEFLFRTCAGSLTAAMACNDSGSNIQLISKQTFEKLGGDIKTIKSTAMNVSNSSGDNTLVEGEVEMEMYSIADKILLYMGKYNFTVIDNPEFDEILLGMECLTKMQQHLERDTVTRGSFTGISCPNGKPHDFPYISNTPSTRSPRVMKSLSVRRGREVRVPVEIQVSVADYIFCSEEMKHKVVDFSRVMINPSLTHKKLRFSDVCQVVSVTILSQDSFRIHKGDPLSNDLAFPEHFDCGCRTDPLDLCMTSTAFYTNGEQTKKYMGHEIVDFPLSGMDFKNGINIDDIAEQPDNDDSFLGHLDPEVRKRISSINDMCQGAFNSKDRPIGEFTGKEFSVPMDPDKFFYQKPIDHKGERGRIVDREIEKLVRAGVVEEATTIGKDNIPCFPVGKAKGKQLIAQKLGHQDKAYDSHRLVLDMRMANGLVPGHGGVLLPSQDDLLCRMHAKYTACLDISAAFHCLKYDKQTKERMRFIHRGKHYLFCRAIMGAILSSQHLEEATNFMFNNLAWKEFLKKMGADQDLELGTLLLVYCDDLILSADSLEQFYLIYRFTLERVRDTGMCLERKKLKILLPVTTILGYDFERMDDGIMSHSIKNSKIQQFLDLPQPQNKRMISSYLASCAIYFKNIIGLKIILAPLYLLLRSESNVFEHVHFRCLSILRLVMSLNLSQACMDPNKFLTIFSDSSLVACNGFSAQFHNDSETGKIQLVPIMNTSKVFDRAGINQPSIHKECYSIIATVKQNEHLIRSNKVATYAITDCRPLCLSLRSRSTTQSLAESAIYLSSLPRFRVMHLRGCEIRTADLASRLFSFGFAKKRKFNKDKAMLFHNKYFGNLSYKISELEHLIDQRESAHYLEISPIKAGKVSVSDLHSRILEDATENEYFNGLVKGFDFIDIYHSLWKPGIKGKNRDYITKAEFEIFVNSGSFREMREALGRDKITKAQIFYHVDKGVLHPGEKGRHRLLVSSGCDVIINGSNTDNEFIEVTVTFPQCPPECSTSVVHGPQVMLESVSASLEVVNLLFHMKSDLIKKEGIQGFPEMLYKCENEHRERVTLGLRIRGSGMTADKLIIIKEKSFYFDGLGASVICHKLHDAIRPMSCYFNNKRINCKKDSPEETSMRKLNSQAAAALLMVAQASHHGPSRFNDYIREMQRSCTAINDIIKSCTNGRTGNDIMNFSMDKQGLLWCGKGKESASHLPVSVDFMELLISNLHTGPIHLSHNAMAALLNRIFICIWPDFTVSHPNKKHWLEGRRIVETLCDKGAQGCMKCIFSTPARIRTMRGSSRHLETDIPGSVWSLDLLEGLPRSPEGFTCILIGSDRASNFTMGLAQKSTSGAETLRNFFSMYSIVGAGLRAVESDGSNCFNKLSEFLCSRGIIHKRHGARSETQGQSECSVKLVRHLLSGAVFDIDVSQRHLWPAVLPDCILTLNNTIVKPAHNHFTRRELFFNLFSGASDLSSSHVENVYTALVKLRNHREETLRKLANDTNIPQLSIGDLCLLKRRKAEILPQVSKEDTPPTRAFLPSSGGQLYRVTAMSPLFVRCNSLIDDSYRTLPKNKVKRLNLDEWLAVNATVPGLVKTIFQSNQFRAGFSRRPAFEKFRKGNLFDEEQIRDHINGCKNPDHCTLLKDIPLHFFYEEDEEEGDFTINESNSILTGPDTSAAEETDLDQSEALNSPESDQLGPIRSEVAIGLDDSIAGESGNTRRITRSVSRKMVNLNRHKQIQTTEAVLRLPKNLREKSILKSTTEGEKSSRRNIHFAENDLLTLYHDHDERWLSAWVKTKHE